jgi:hypothetical protein
METVWVVNHCEIESINPLIIVTEIIFYVASSLEKAEAYIL